MRISHFCLGFALLLAACGGSQPPASSPSGASTGPSAPAAAEEDTSAPKPTIESQREPFMQGCMRKVNAPDYCECGWDNFREVFKDADLSKPLPENDPRLATLQEKTIATCGSKLPEESIKESFVGGCTEDEQRRAPYCECAWTAMRKKLAASDFIGSFEGPRVEEAKKAVVVACKGKFPAELAKADFMKECNAPHCECAWTKLRAKYSVEAIVAGTADLASVPGLKDCKSTARPAPNVAREVRPALPR